MASFFRFHLFQMKYSLGIQALRYRIRTTSGLLPKLFALLIPILLLAVAVLTPYVFILYLCYEIVNMVGSAEHYITLVLFMTQCLVLFFALLSSFTVMFGRKDHEMLSALPIPKRYVYMSSVLQVYGSGIISAALVLIPSLVIYGIGQGFSLQMVLMAIPAIFFAPILPVCIAYAFVLLLMRLIALCPFREQLATVFGLIFVVGYMIFNYSFSAKFGVWFSSLDFAALFERAGWFSVLVKILPGVYLTRVTMLGSFMDSLLAFCLLFIISGGLLFGMYWVGGKSFFAVRAGMNVYAGRRQASNRYKESNPFFAYIKKEYRGLLRSPIYVMNGLIGVVIGPIMLLCITANEGISSLSTIGEVMYNETGAEKWRMLPILIVLGIAIFAISTISVVPGSSYSREGLSRWVTQVAPVSGKTDFVARAIASLVLFWIGDLLMWIVGWSVLRFSLFNGLFYFVPLALSAVPCVFLSLYVDFKHPKLVWEREAQAMKQNANTMIALLLSWVTCILCILPIGLYMFDYLNKKVCLILTLAVPVLLAVACVGIIVNKLNRRIVV